MRSGLLSMNWSTAVSRLTACLFLLQTHASGRRETHLTTSSAANFSSTEMADSADRRLSQQMAVLAQSIESSTATRSATDRHLDRCSVAAESTHVGSGSIDSAT